MPLQSFYQKQTVYIILFILAICTSLLLGLALSWIFTRRLSRPVSSMLSQLNIDGANKAYPDAIRAVESSLEEYRKNLQDAHGLLNNTSRQSRNTFLYALCRGNLSEKKIEEGISKYQISVQDGCMHVILFTYHDADSSVFYENGFLDGELLLYASRNMIEELLIPQNGAVCIHDNQLICIFPVNGSLPKEDETQQILEEIYRFHKEILQVEIHIFITARGEGYAEIPELFLQAEEMLQYKSFWDKDVSDILKYEEISNADNMEERYDSFNAEKRFVNLLAIRDYEGAHTVLMEQLSAYFSKELGHLQKERYKIYGFISNLMESMSYFSGEADSGEGEELLQASNDLLLAKSVDELRQKSDILFQHIIRYQEEQNPRDMAPWVSEVSDYIKTHYADSQLDVSYLAEIVHLNVSHLSRTYKKATSIGILDYIHMVRISKAKELLTEGKSVQETAVGIGYPDSRALIRVFKRYEGVTPGQFQEMNLRNLL